MTERESVMTVFAGTNGAGKSTISLQMRDYVGTIIDPDQIAKKINPEDPRSADLSAGREAVKKIRELIRRKDNFAIETTLSGSFALRHMKTAKEQGGHWIAEEDIRWRYGQSLSNLKPALEISDEVTIIDNTSEPEVVAEIKRSQISFCRQEIPTWARGALELYLHNH
ncbi:hypothetical protein PaeBR_00970 [Paenibacillus sp. BR2-3]|uniref:hypothetical protein n=1 Tax=Paenibacillus sp. BR2-3 TaxID=3048494 RepID=UPI003977313A